MRGVASRRTSKGVAAVGIDEGASDAPKPSRSLDPILARYRPALGEALLQALADARTSKTTSSTHKLLDGLNAQIEYHLGWRTPNLQPRRWQPGKLLRPTLLLLASEIATGQADQSAETQQGRPMAVQRALPAAVAVELVHNFSLIHDDIEDGDSERHHQPTLWKLYGIPQAINTGDYLFALARLQLRQLRERGVPAETILDIAAQLDATCLELCEGQYLDMSFEGRHDITEAMYLDMIGRKTAALMDCAARIGSRIGAPENEPLSERLGAFGRALGMGFQLRDDMLGIWSAGALGKSEAGDLRQKKMSLPVIAALEHATPDDRAMVTRIYGEPGTASEPQITALLDMLERTSARERTRAVLHEYGERARALLDRVCSDIRVSEAREACAALASMLEFVAAEGI
jgi:geranylgeranyl diphosphate synthase, type I